MARATWCLVLIGSMTGCSPLALTTCDAMSCAGWCDAQDLCHPEGSSEGTIDSDAGAPDAGLPPSLFTRSSAGSEPLMPLTVGLTWHYTFARGSLPNCDLEHSESVTQALADPTDDAFVLIQTSCPALPALEYKSTPTGVWTRRSGEQAWELLLELPAIENKTFNAGPSGRVAFRWVFVPHLETPAGSFSGCWAVEQLNTTKSRTYCPGIGLVAADTSNALTDFRRVLTATEQH